MCTFVNVLCMVFIDFCDINYIYNLLIVNIFNDFMIRSTAVCINSIALVIPEPRNQTNAIYMMI